jgi:hypothetical protein
MKLAIHPFIFTWKRQFEKACRIEDQLKEIFGKVTVINSDDDNSRDGWINIGDSCYFGEQFRRAVQLFDGDVLFHVQGDVEYDNWKRLVEDAKFYFRFYEAGIYAPNVDYCWWNSQRTDINSRQLEHKNLKLVATTDETVWFIRKEVLAGIKERNIDMTKNPLGWGWDCVLSCISHSKGLPVIRDYRHTITHPQGTGYNFDAATKGMDDLVASLDEDLRILYSYIRGDREQLLTCLDPRASTARVP